MKLTNLEYAAALRDLAAFYETHPIVPPTDLTVYLMTQSRQEIGEILRALAPIAVVSKDPDDYFFEVCRTFGAGLNLSVKMARRDICERKFVTRTVYEWQCSDAALAELLTGGPEQKPVQEPVETPDVE